MAIAAAVVFIFMPLAVDEACFDIFSSQLVRRCSS
jgi:hypothetical protein